MPRPLDDQEVFALERPHSNLLAYYIVRSVVLGPFFFLLLVPLFFRYRTLRYRFDDEGISMRWGVLFRREINLTYARIQDIHLTSNVVERWLDLARVQIQTASGSSKAEMTIEGILEFEAVRDFLYSRMRGVREQPSAEASDRARVSAASAATGRQGEVRLDAATAGRLAKALEAVADELEALRRSAGGNPGPGRG